jgi:hypothetical protein
MHGFLTSAKKAYEMQFDDSLESSFLAQVWNVWKPSRYKVFIWLLLQGRIWTADRLLRQKWKNEYFYPLCIRNMETVLHVPCCSPNLARNKQLDVVLDTTPELGL